MRCFIILCTRYCIFFATSSYRWRFLSCQVVIRSNDAAIPLRFEAFCCSSRLWWLSTADTRLLDSWTMASIVPDLVLSPLKYMFISSRVSWCDQSQRLSPEGGR